MRKLGALIISLDGKTLSAEEKDLLSHPMVGGVILFSRNYENRHQMKALCDAIKASRQLSPLILVDQEGGSVQRFLTEFTKLPAMAYLGNLYDQSPELACQWAKEIAWLMAAELLSVGIDLSLAPVLDLHKNKNLAIRDRAFHAQPEIVVKLALSFIQGMHEAGMASTGKHFPGHGSVIADSHLSTPIDDRSYDEILKEDLQVFIEMKSELTALMSSHIIFPQIDSLPVTYSHKWLTDILKNKLQFNGIIFSDDLNMEGANFNLDDANRMQVAREAGCDFILFCNNRNAVINCIDQLKTSEHLIEENRWQVFQGKQNHRLLQQNLRWQEVSKYLATLN